jgi:CRP-like cAMP-binding protein
MDKNLSIETPIEAANVFSGLTEEQFARLGRSGEPVKHPPKFTLFRQGDAAEKCYLVQRGRLKLAKLNEAGKEAIIRYIGAGEIAAAVSVSPTPRPW